MKQVFKMLEKIVIALFASVFGIIEIVIRAVIPIWKGLKNGYVWFGIFNQPFVVLFTLIPILPQLDFLLIPESRIVWLIIIAFEIIVLNFLINAVIELIFNFSNKEDVYENVQELQKYSNNYVLIIISLLALYVSALPQTVRIDNLELLVIGSIYFLSTISSDIYRVFIFSKGEVKELAQKIKSTFNNNF